ncbi:nuclease A inhibitor family protein [Persicitalea sp.]|uniref:nuclease A inhibitor family protein n=1 Tax=Persicitalea sp. TaxID=3100273 RepID=UPI003594245A
MLPNLLVGLLYPSESDEPVHFLSAPWKRPGETYAREFEELFGLEAAEEVAELVPERFWASVTIEQEWHGAEERERTASFSEIRRIMEENLKHIQYFEVGEVEVSLYLVGQSENNIMGIKTTANRT